MSTDLKHLLNQPQPASLKLSPAEQRKAAVMFICLAFTIGLILFSFLLLSVLKTTPAPPALTIGEGVIQP